MKTITLKDYHSLRDRVAELEDEVQVLKHNYYVIRRGMSDMQMKFKEKQVRLG